jgi:hypothetical protein
MLEVRLAYRPEADLQVQLAGFLNQSVLKAEKIVGRDFDQQAKDKRFMDNSLPDIKHAGVVVRQNCSQRRGKSWFICTGEMNQYRFVHGQGLPS